MQRFLKTSKPCHVGIHGKALAEYSHMSTHVAGFQSFLRSFALIVFVKLATSSTKVNIQFLDDSNVYFSIFCSSCHILKRISN